MTSGMLRVAGFVDGAWLDAAADADPLRDKFSGDVIAEVAATDRETISRAVRSLDAARGRGLLTPRQRADVLARAAAGVAARREDLIATVQADTGFARGDAVKEVDRTAETLTLCAEEAKRHAGHLVPVEGTPTGAGKLSYTRVDPIGIVCALTPFNSPLNTVAHKVGPAIAAGNSVILKPASLTPLSAQALVQILLEAGLPPEMIALVYGSGASRGAWLADEKAIGYYAFTGSTEVGATLFAAVGMRRTQLEMGSLASTIVCADADLPRAAAAITAGALRKSGQVCTSVQRVYAHAAIRDELAGLVAAGMRAEIAGDPADAATTVGPLITGQDAARVQQWVDEAVAGGADVVCGGARDGNVVAPTLLTGVRDDDRIMRSELFGPAVVMRDFTDLDDAIAQVNDTPYGLAAGIFTDSLAGALDAADALQVGALYVNETSSSRTDAMPFGGLKASGFGGAEGPAYAIRDMSVERVITITRR